MIVRAPHMVLAVHQSVKPIPPADLPEVLPAPPRWEEPPPTVLPVPKTRLWLVLLVFGLLYPILLVAGSLLSWFFAGTPALTYGLLGSGGGVGLLVFVALIFLLADRRPRVRRRCWACLGHAIALGFVLVVAAAIHLLFPQARVHLDNNYAEDVQLELDGKPWLHLPTRSTTRRWLRKGTYTLVVRSADDARELDRMEITVDGAGNYVLNVLGAMRYYRGRALYEINNRGGLREPDEVVVTDRWFRANAYYLFQTPPEKIWVQDRRHERPGPISRGYLERDPELPLREVP
jgi:hypothetical protein